MKIMLSENARNNYITVGAHNTASGKSFRTTGSGAGICVGNSAGRSVEKGIGEGPGKSSVGTGHLQSKQIHELKKMAANLGKTVIEERVAADGKTIIGGKTLWQVTSKNSVLNGLSDYSESLRSQRSKSKDTNRALKTLKYQYKNISSKILRSKTSANANQVASQARREVLRLKRQKLNPDADPEELEAAIVHAKSMERVARKKAKHLLEEEMAKASMMNSDKEESLSESSASESSVNENLYSDEYAREDYSGEDSLQEDCLEAYSLEEDSFVKAGPEEAFDDAMSLQLSKEYDAEYEMEDQAILDMMELMDDFDESMQDLMEDMGLDELTDSLELFKKDLSEEELKEVKIKHRNKEMKEIVKADADYLKVVFDKLQTQAAAGTVATSGGVPTSEGTPAPTISILV